MPALHDRWDLTILDAMPETGGLASLAIGDIDGDGNLEIVTGGNDALLWYRPATLDKGVIARDTGYGVGIALEDIDGDGLPEVVTSHSLGGYSKALLAWYRPSDRQALDRPWDKGVIDPHTGGCAHDILFTDIDGDGQREMIANAACCAVWGLYIYKRQSDPSAPWRRVVIQEGHAEEGLDVGDITGNGALDIVSGTTWYEHPGDDPLSTPWKRHHFAHTFREMVRVACCDITGNGRADIFMVESEYIDGKMSWFENRCAGASEHALLEHPIDDRLTFAHSLALWPTKKAGTTRFFVAEMAAGGWEQPYNHDALLLEYTTTTKGSSWNRSVLDHGTGTHQALVCDIDKDGEDEIVGKTWIRHLDNSQVQVWKHASGHSPINGFTHRFLDLDKPHKGTDIVIADIDGDGRQDFACGRWWYRNPTWERFEIPGICQVIHAYDIDGDGRKELVATRIPQGNTGAILSNELCWLKARDDGSWELHDIGTGTGDWPHGSLIGPYGPCANLALVCGYHCADGGVFPDIFEPPADPAAGPWTKRVLAEIPYGEEFAAADIDGDGIVEIIAGPYILKPTRDGAYETHRITSDFRAARVAVVDINGDGKLDIVLSKQALDFENKHTPFSHVVWCENPGSLNGHEWNVHPIDKVRCAHSLGLADMDGDGEMELIVGEHDPFKPYRTRCRTYVYKKADPAGISWKRYILDTRFEHHDGVKPIDLGDGKVGIVSHGWNEDRYIHLWERTI